MKMTPSKGFLVLKSSSREVELKLMMLFSKRMHLLQVNYPRRRKRRRRRMQTFSLKVDLQNSFQNIFQITIKLHMKEEMVKMALMETLTVLMRQLHQLRQRAKRRRRRSQQSRTPSGVSQVSISRNPWLLNSLKSTGKVELQG
jgi:hypothetical protein